MNYLVLDLETANCDCGSICQVGIVAVAEGEVVGTRAYLIDPECDFDPWNIRIHGIEAVHVRGQPKWPDLFDELAPMLAGSLVVTHGPFDRTAIHRACGRYGLDMPAVRWLDNQRVVRRTWPAFAKKGYALDNLARHFGIPLRHHDALEDAVATEKILRLALRETGQTVSAWFEVIEQGRSTASAPRTRYSDAEKRAVDPGPIGG